MSAKDPLPRLPYVLFAALTLASFGGPFVILVMVRGGESPRWPPDRPVEWVAITLVFSLVIVLFLACVSIGIWHPPARRSHGPENNDIDT